MHISLSVEVESLRSDGKVQIWAQGEKYDPATQKMKLQPENEGWLFYLTPAKATEMIRNNRAN